MPAPRGDIIGRGPGTVGPLHSEAGSIVSGDEGVQRGVRASASQDQTMSENPLLHGTQLVGNSSAGAVVDSDQHLDAVKADAPEAERCSS